MFSCATYARIACLSFYHYRENQEIAVQMWDTSGDERYQAIASAYYTGAKGFIVVMDLTNENSLQDAEK